MPEQDPMTLYHQFQQIYVLLDDADRRTLRAFDLTPTQYNLLLRLGADLATGQTISELAEKLLCTRGNVTRLVQRLAQQGLVATGGDGNDQRLVRVALTPLGWQQCQAAQAAHEASVQRRLGGLTHQRQETLAELTTLLVEALSADLAHFSQA